MEVIFTEENNESFAENNAFSVNRGFFRQKKTPLWKIEREKIIAAGNGNGAAIICYLVVSNVLVKFFWAVLEEVYLFGAFGLYEFLGQMSDTLIYVFSLVLSYGLMLIFTKCPVKVALPFRRAKPDMLICGVLMGLGITVVATYLSAYFDNVFYMLGFEIVMPDTGRPENIPAYVLYGISTVIIPAFVEEMAFRGVVMQSLRRYGDGFALVMSSFLFGICHMNLYQIPYAMLVGLCIGYFVMRSGSLWVGIIIHLFNNGAAFVVEYFLDVSKADEALVGTVNGAYRVLCILLGIASMIYLVLKYKDMFSLAPAETVLTEGRKLRYFMLSPVMIFVMAAAVYLSAKYINVLWW